MSNYSIALFLHVIGALGFFVVQGVEWFGLSQIRRARLPEEAHAIIGVIKRTNQLGFISILTTVITGIYMMLTYWGWVAWILVVLGALILEIALFVVLSGPRMAALEHVLDTEEGPVSQAFLDLVNHPILWISLYTRTAILLGIVFLKIAKPDLGGSLLTIGISIVLGVASAFPILRRERVQERSVARMIIAFIVPVFIAVLVLFATNSIPPSTISLSKTKSGLQGVQTPSAEVATEVSSSNFSTQTPTASLEVALLEGQLLLQTQCTQCHPLQQILQVKKTRTEWENALSKMESFNVKISDTEKKVLLDYLSTVDNP
jgi:hypothetical protein